MHGPKGMGFSVVLATTFLVATTVHLPANEPEPMSIGMVQSIFTDVPPAIIKGIVVPTFKRLMKDQTGLDGQLVIGGDALDVAERLMDGKLQLAVFHGVEYAWAQQKHKELKPLMIAVHKTRHLKAHLVVRQDSEAAGFADFKGKELALPSRSKEHCRLFIERNCQECDRCAAKTFFSQVIKSPHVEAALDGVCTGELPCTVVDNVNLELYQKVKPGCFKRLKVIQDSEVFPTAVIVYREKGLDDETLNRFRTGMMNANQDAIARDVMSMFKIDAFEPVPEEYPQMLTEILKAYPSPSGTAP